MMSNTSSTTDFDAIVVGAGPNGLAAAVTLARAGLAVRVYEKAATIGGGSRTAELTLPGFRHDVCSAVHPLALASGFFRQFELEKRIELVVPELRKRGLLPETARTGTARQMLTGSESSRLPDWHPGTSFRRA